MTATRVRIGGIEWALVPVELSDEMYEAAQLELSMGNEADGAYEAFLAAAPAAEVPPPMYLAPDDRSLEGITVYAIEFLPGAK